MTKPVDLALYWLDHGRGLPEPAYQTEGAAGMDLCAAIEGELRIAPGRRALIPCGCIIAIPPGFEGQVRARSGLALKHGIAMPNAPGTIDSDYRGELKVILINLGDQDFVITRAMRIAQLVIAPVARAQLRIVPTADLLSATTRGVGGFGSTG